MTALQKKIKQDGGIVKPGVRWTCYFMQRIKEGSLLGCHINRIEESGGERLVDTSGETFTDREQPVPQKKEQVWLCLVASGGISLPGGKKQKMRSGRHIPWKATQTFCFHSEKNEKPLKSSKQRSMWSTYVLKDALAAMLRMDNG